VLLVTGLLTTFCKYTKSAKWYDGFVQNLVTVLQIHQGLCMFNYVQRGAGLHLSEPNVKGLGVGWNHFFGTHCRLLQDQPSHDSRSWM